MLEESFIDKNVELYLSKMEEKHRENKEKIESLEQVLVRSARVIQRCWRRYVMRKKTRGAIKIQRLFR